ncbi:MAG TPA: protein translocase subunit SecF [Gammaproteobacteria bacterium]|nr:protein translocase subunit SecF [Gammaproteobacteria bacterium]
MAYRRAAAALSVALTIGALILIFTKGLNFGMDFTGGLLLEVESGAPVELASIRSALDAGGFANAQVQNIGGGTELLIRLPPQTGTEDASALEARLIETLQTLDSSIMVRRTEFVGPQVGEDLTEQGSMAMLIALMLIFIYVMLRFRWKLALGAIVATVHDVIVTVGFFSVTWLSFDLTVLGAILAVIGYSLNDTIVVFDRVRENFRLMRRGSPEAIMDSAINQTLARTIVTGLTTLLVLVALFIFGGDTLRGFSVALIVGIVVGTYSSIYVASATALGLDIVPTDLVPQKREQVDDLP